MKIYVDADACPVVIKDILYRVSQRTGIEVILVANQPLSTPEYLRLNPYVSARVLMWPMIILLAWLKKTI